MKINIMEIILIWQAEHLLRKLSKIPSNIILHTIKRLLPDIVAHLREE